MPNYILDTTNEDNIVLVTQVTPVLDVQQAAKPVLDVVTQNPVLEVAQTPTVAQVVVQQSSVFEIVTAGPVGPAGPPGANGQPGQPGAQGANGQPRYSGIGPPPVTIIGSQPGDSYVDLSDGTTYILE